MNAQNEQWLGEFIAETAPEITEPLMQCLAAAIAAVESGWGRRTIRGQGPRSSMLNEIGYKAVAGKPSTTARTQEADGPGGALQTHTGVAFRLFAGRTEQARSLRYLMRSSAFFEAARLLFVLAFYSGYAPGRTAGAKELLQVFNTLAASGRFDGVRPMQLIDAKGVDPETAELNHAAARRAVQMFGELTGIK